MLKVNLKPEIIEKLDKIQISRVSRSVEVNNPTSYQMLGKGHQGAVFQIDESRCVKIYCSKIDLIRELHALQLGGKIGICPIVYFWGENYIVMEYLTDPSLLEYLQQNPLNKELAAKIVNLLDLFEKAGFNRFDHSGRHIYVSPKGTMKIIDVVHIIKPQPVYLPKKLITDMGVNAEEFVQFVKEISPKWYKRWVNDPDFSALMTKVKGTI